VNLPQTLHGQLYLLAYDRKRHRFDGDNLPLFGLALRAAMLTDLYLTGYIEDKDGKAHRSSVTTPDDPVLRTVCVQIGSVFSGGRDWARLIAEDEEQASAVVRDQLKATIIPTARLAPSEEDAVSGLADQVTEALRNAIDGRESDPRPLAVGLLAVLGQMPTVFSFKESARHREQIRELIFAAIAPIVGLQQAIGAHDEDLRASLLRPRGWISNRLMWT
jgi:Golgi phosphoprotein 3 (GPP34)